MTEKNRNKMTMMGLNNTFVQEEYLLHSAFGRTKERDIVFPTFSLQ